VNREGVRKKIIGIFREQAIREMREKVSLDSRLIEDLGMDSLGLVESLMALEEEFVMEIPDVDADNMLKVQDAVDYIIDKKRNRA